MPAGEVVFELDSFGHEFYIILHGQVDVFVYLPGEQSKEEKFEIFSLPDKPKKADLSHEELKKRFKSSFAPHSKIQTSPNTTILNKVNGTYLLHKQNLLKKVNTVAEGGSFGEAALTTKKNCQRNATIFAVKDCHFAVLDRETFSKVISKVVHLEVVERIAFVKSLSFFEPFDETTLQTLVYGMTVARYSFRQPIIKQGQLTDNIFLVDEGSVVITKKLQTSSEDQKDVIVKVIVVHQIARLDRGGIFGEDLLFKVNKPSTYEVRSDSATCKM